MIWYRPILSRPRPELYIHLMMHNVLIYTIQSRGKMSQVRQVSHDIFIDGVRARKFSWKFIKIAGT